VSAEVPQVVKMELSAFLTAVHELHRRAGYPSTRRVARASATPARQSVSHATVAELLSGKRLPSWDVVEAVTLALGGNVAQFRRLWTAAYEAERHVRPLRRQSPRVSLVLTPARPGEPATVTAHLDETEATNQARRCRGVLVRLPVTLDFRFSRQAVSERGD
jgi:hypothetical protein